MDPEIRLGFRAVEMEDKDPRLSEALWDASNTVGKAQAALYAIALSTNHAEARMLATTAIQAIRLAGRDA